MKCKELRGLKSYFALQSYGKLILGLKMLPMYMGETYEAFLKRIEQMSDKDQETIIREAAFLVDLTHDEILNLARFCTDVNGVPYTDENMKNLKADQIFEIIVTVCLECVKIRPQLLSDDEKKNL